MEPLLFDKSRHGCSEKLHKVIEEILSNGKDENVGAIGFMTTDNFYGSYVIWNYLNVCSTERKL